MLYLAAQRKSDSYLNQAINIIKFYYEVVMGMPNRYYELKRLMKTERLPKVLSKKQVLTMINSCGNIKHRCILSLLYSAGLRRSELLALKPTDLDSDRITITVRAGMGNKDRVTLLSTRLLDDLRRYYKACNPRVYLFEGSEGKAYSQTSVAKVVSKAAMRACIGKRVTPHMLRHSFAGALQRCACLPTPLRHQER